MDRSLFALPPNLEHALRQLSEKLNAPIYKYGGFLRDRALGFSPRDLDLLIHYRLNNSDYHILKNAFSESPKLLSLLPTNSARVIVNLVRDEQCPVNQLDLIDATGFVRMRGMIPSLDPWKVACQVADITDFTINAIIQEIGESQKIYAHPLWEKDIESKTIRLTTDQLGASEFWLPFKAVRLEYTMRGTIEPHTVSILRRGLCSARWDIATGQLFLKHFYRVFTVQEPWKSVFRLWDLGFLDVCLPTQIAPDALEATYRAIIADDNLPSFGSDGKASWLLALLLRAQSAHDRERFFSRLIEADRTHLTLALQQLDASGLVN